MKKNAIVAEGDNLTEELMLLEELKEKHQNESTVKINIEILILLAEKSEHLAKFAHNAGIPLVIYFNFKNVSKDYTDLLPTFLNAEFKYGILKNFIKNIINTQSVTNALTNAEQDTIENMQHVINSEYEMVEVEIPSLQERLAED